MPRHSIASVCLAAFWLLGIGACGGDDLNGGDDSRTPCRTSLDCPGTQICRFDRFCGPGDGSDPDPGPGREADKPYLQGAWSVEYSLDWSEYMGPLAELGRPIDVVDQVLAGNGNLVGIPLAGSVIEGWIDQYIPNWVRDLVSVLNSFVQFFQDVRMSGVMQVRHDPEDYDRLLITEEWQWGYLTVIEQCPLGTSDINYPECATLGVPLNNYVNRFGAIEAYPRPYTGRLIDEGSGRWSIALDQRLVDIQIGRFLRFVLDQLTKIVTNRRYEQLTVALSSVVDCSAFTQDFATFLCNSLGLCNAEGPLVVACGEAVEYGAGEFEEQLQEVAVDWEAMSFGQSAEITFDRRTGSGRSMGTRGAPGTIEDGSFELVFDVPLTGTWRAWR